MAHELDRFFKLPPAPERPVRVPSELENEFNRALLRSSLNDQRSTLERQASEKGLGVTVHRAIARKLRETNCLIEQLDRIEGIVSRRKL